MKLILGINNVSRNPIRDSFFRPIIKKTLEKSDFKFIKSKTISISLAIVSKAEIKKLNKIYRKKNEPTDVLSFAEYKNIKEIKEEKGEEIFLGELVLCYDDIKGYSSNNNLDLKAELSRVVSHGVLHLLGFKHGKKMFGVQDAASGK